MPVEKVKSLLKIPGNDTVIWYHAAPCKEGLALRSIPCSLQKDWKVVRKVPLDDLNENCQQYSLQEVSGITGLPATEFSVREPEAWSLLAKRMGLLQKKPKTKVPITDLRRVYELLRTLNESLKREKANELHLAIAKGFLASPAAFASLWKSSLDQFCTYEPGNLAYLDHRRKPLPANVKDPLQSTNTLVAAIQGAEGLLPVVDHPELRFTYVERELNPRRTKDAIYESGEPASSSGTGGTDVLLRSNDGVPIIGEIKVNRDTNPFFGLVQVLTYAVEFCIPQQIARLATSFPVFRGLDVKQVDAYLILAQCPSDKIYAELLNCTRNIAETMCNGGMLPRLRRLVCLKATAPEGHNISFGARIHFHVALITSSSDI